MYIQNTQELVLALYEVKGTPDHAKYEMECHVRSDKGRWIFVGYYSILDPQVIVADGGKYIYNGRKGDERRYTVTAAVAELLGL